MKTGFYAKLAVTGMRKNKRLYLPYLLTCACMVMMFYIVAYLATSPVLAAMKGGDSVQSMLGMGTMVILVFSVLFLFYTNSFLMRRRKREFGLYNILGMDKRNLARILAWESLFVALVSLVSGLALGVGLSKLSELLLVNLLGEKATLAFTVSAAGLWQSILFYAGVFFVIFLNALRQVCAARPVDLMRAESAGEKPPRANWALGLLGAALLAAAYIISVKIDNPVSAVTMFFFAVLMVVVGTYLLFIAGSVTVCRILKWDKKFYYQPRHFVSVSSMAYRMKRNGAGLASICILATMVLVMISTTTCLFFGAEDSLRTRYPNQIEISVILPTPDDASDAAVDKMQAATKDVIAAHGAAEKNATAYRSAYIAGLFKDGVLDTSMTDSPTVDLLSAGDLCQAYLIPLSDYNAMAGTDETLAAGEALVYPVHARFQSDSFEIAGGGKYRVHTLDSFPVPGSAAAQILPSIFVVVPDFDAIASRLYAKDNTAISLSWSCGFDTDIDEDAQIALNREIYYALRNLRETGELGMGNIDCQSAAGERGDFYGTYGGLFFLGILLSVVFISAAVLIIYYKQISEGYEDQGRFDIMQKVGMTRQDIRRSINAQLLMVFFLPLVFAALHLAFAFPFIRKILILFNLTNLALLLGVTAASFIVFAAFYTVVYRATSNAYYHIVAKE